MQKFPGPGMFQSQQVGMESLPAQCSQRRLALGPEMAGLGLEVGAIDSVAHQGMADMGEVHPDLMGPPGLELAGQKRGDRFAVTALISRLQLPMRDRLAAAFADRHLFAGIRMPVNRRVYRAALTVGYPPDEGH